MANYRGVSYTDAPQTYRQPQNMVGSFAGGMQLGQAVKRLIDDKRSSRKLDRLLSSLGEKPPTQQQYTELAKLAGPDVANQILNYHETTQKINIGERDLAVQNAGITADAAGMIVEGLRKFPEERRMEALTTTMLPLFEKEGPMRDQLRPIVEIFKDGNFSDERLDTLGSMAYSFGRYQKITDDKITMQREDDEIARKSGEFDREATIAEGRLDLGRSELDFRKEALELERTQADAQAEAAKLAASNNPQAMVEKMMEQYGGDRPSWHLLMLGDKAHNLIKESVDAEGSSVFVNTMTNEPLNLGSWQYAAGPPGEFEIQPGSPGATLRRDQIHPIW